jgi:hypothetical protein
LPPLPFTEAAGIGCHIIYQAADTNIYQAADTNIYQAADTNAYKA